MASCRAAGSCACNSGSSALIASTTSTVLVPGWRAMPGRSSACRCTSWRSAGSRRRRRRWRLHSAAPGCRCGRRRGSAGTAPPSISWPLVCTTKLRCGPYRVPVGRLTFAPVDRLRRPGRCRSAAPRAASGRHRCGRRILRAEHVDAGDAADHREPLREHGLRVLVDLRQRHRLGAEREEQDRLVGRIDLLVRRRRRHARRQLARRARDHRLHVLRRRVDVAAQIELQRDVGVALAVASS